MTKIRSWRIWEKEGCYEKKNQLTIKRETLLTKPEEWSIIRKITFNGVNEEKLTILF